MDKILAGISIGVVGLAAAVVIAAMVALLGGLVVWVVWDNFIAGDYYTKAGAIALTMPVLGYWKSVAIWFICQVLFKSTSVNTKSD